MGLGLPQLLADLAAHGGKVQAIKLVRETLGGSGIGLKEAKDIVDRRWEELGPESRTTTRWPTPEEFQDVTAGNAVLQVELQISAFIENDSPANMAMNVATFIDSVTEAVTQDDWLATIRVRTVPVVYRFVRGGAVPGEQEAASGGAD